MRGRCTAGDAALVQQLHLKQDRGSGARKWRGGVGIQRDVMRYGQAGGDLRGVEIHVYICRGLLSELRTTRKPASVRCFD